MSRVSRLVMAMPAVAQPLTPAAPFSEPRHNIVDMLNNTRLHHDRGSRRRRPNRRRTTLAPSTDADHDHDHGDGDNSTNVDQGGQTSGVGSDNGGDDHDADDHDHNTDHEDFSCQPTTSKSDGDSATVRTAVPSLSVNSCSLFMFVRRVCVCV